MIWDLCYSKMFRPAYRDLCEKCTQAMKPLPSQFNYCFARGFHIILLQQANYPSIYAFNFVQFFVTFPKHVERSWSLLKKFRFFPACHQLHFTSHIVHCLSQNEATGNRSTSHNTNSMQFLTLTFNLFSSIHSSTSSKSRPSKSPK